MARQQFREGGRPTVGGQDASVLVDTVSGRKASREQTAVRRERQRRHRLGRLENHPFSGEPIEMWRQAARRPVCPHPIGAEGVQRDDHEVQCGALDAARQVSQHARVHRKHIAQHRRCDDAARATGCSEQRQTTHRRQSPVAHVQYPYLSALSGSIRTSRCLALERVHAAFIVSGLRGPRDETWQHKCREENRARRELNVAHVPHCFRTKTGCRGGAARNVNTGPHRSRP
jgi:hypothetical protein